MAELNSFPAVNSRRVEIPGLMLEELMPTTAANLRADPQDPAFMREVHEILGIKLPLEPNRFLERGDQAAIWLGPDEWLVLAAEALLSDNRNALKTVSLTDVTANRITFRVSGDLARELLSAGCSLDLHPRAFSPGQCAQTNLARTQIVLMQRDQAPTFDIMVRRSFARYLWDWLSAAARTFPAAAIPALG